MINISRQWYKINIRVDFEPRAFLILHLQSLVSLSSSSSSTTTRCSPIFRFTIAINGGTRVELSVFYFVSSPHYPLPPPPLYNLATIGFFKMKVGWEKGRTVDQLLLLQEIRGGDVAGVGQVGE